MIRWKHSSRWRYRKCYFLLSSLSISLIILYCIISRKQNFLLLTWGDNANYNTSHDIGRDRNIGPNILSHSSKKHVVDSNKEQRDWHIDTQQPQVTRDHVQTKSASNRLQGQQQQKQHQHNNNKSIHQAQDAILNLSANEFGRTSIANSTYNLKLMVNKNNNNKNSNNYIYNEKSSQLTGFNVELSNRLPVKRLIPDTRHESCKRKLYPGPLPPCSIIIVYYNEEASVILRTLYSLIHRTPKEILKEIILVDDYSDANKELEDHIEHRLSHTVHFVHLPKREGLIRARLKGAKKSLADILVFLDAHVEVNENWLPPLLVPIQEDDKTCTTPVIDVIKFDTLEYQAAMPSRGAFNWHFNYVQLPLLKAEKNVQPQPHSNPIMNGGLFVIRKEYFWLLGGYDEGLDIWGAEQFELSFKIWMCGGRLLEVPCSRVGHLYRDPEFRIKYTDRKDDFISKNYKRVAEVWMDEYKEYLYEHIPKLSQIEAGNLSQQKTLRNKLQCKSFKWFLLNVAPDILKAYPPIEPNDFALGAIQSLAEPKLCIDLGSTTRHQILKDALQICSPDLKYPYASQRFHLSFRHDLRHQENCLEVRNWSSRAPIWLWPCHNLGGNQYWFYDRNTQMFVQGMTDYAKRCLELDSVTLELFVNFCDFAKREQKWQMGYVNETAMEHFFEE